VSGGGATRRRAALAAAALAAATAGLFLVSRGKWSDPLIDSGREWIVPDALARGELLYRDVVYWFGPFTPYFHAAFFRVFGSSFSSLVAAGAVASVGTLAALFFALTRVTERRDAALWTALAIPALVFMPHAGGSILGMGYRMWHAATFALLAVAVAAGARWRREAWRVAAAGCLAGLAGLCRTEWGIAALMAVSLVVLRREQGWRRKSRDTILAVTGFLAIFGGALLPFVISAGWDALIFEAPVLLLHVPAETRSNVAFAGLRAFPGGLCPLFYSPGIWIGIFLLAEIVSLRRADPARARRRLPVLLLLLAAFALSGWAGGLSGGPLFSAAPLLCAISCLVGVQPGEGPRPALLGFGALGLVLSYRRFFYILDGPYVAPPLLFALVCAAGLLETVAFDREARPLRERLRTGVSLALVAVIVLAFTGRLVQYASWDGTPVPGTANMLFAQESVSRELAQLAGTIRRETEEGEGLIVFPEGEILNFLSGRPNPIPHKLYLPGYLTSENEQSVLSELSRANPGAIVVWRRPTSEYGRGFFGEDYGQHIGRWIEANYAMNAFHAEGNPRRTNPVFSYGLRRKAAARAVHLAERDLRFPVCHSCAEAMPPGWTPDRDGLLTSCASGRILYP